MVIIFLWKKITLFVLCFLFVTGLFSGCDKLSVEKDLTNECLKISNNLIQDFYNKQENVELPNLNDNNFYILIDSNYTENLSAITINNFIYKADTKIKLSLENNNSLDFLIWKLIENKFYIALPTLYVEANGGYVKIEKVIKII